MSEDPSRASTRPYLRIPAQVWLWLPPLVFLLLFFFLPLGAILRLAGVAVLQNGLRPVVWDQIGQALVFTIWQAALSTFLTLLVGLPAAYLFGRYTFPGKGLLKVITTLPFILPTVVVAAAFNALLGPSGWLNLALMRLLGVATPPIQIFNTLWIILLAHVFYNTSIIIRVVGSAWAQLDPRLEQAGRVLGASPRRNLWEVTLPLLRPSILAATVLVFLFDFTSYGVILLLGGPHFATMEVEIYIQTMQMLNLPAAGVLSTIQLLCTLLVMVVYQRLSRGQDLPLTPRLHGEGTHPPKGRLQFAFVAATALWLIALLALPLLALGFRSITYLDANNHLAWTLDFYRELFINRRQSYFYVPPVQALANSLTYAGLTIVFSLTLGMLATYALRAKSRLNKVLEGVLMLPLGASAVTLGLGFIITFNHPPLDVQSFPLLIPIVHALVALPFVVRTLQPALASIPPSLGQVAAVLGAAPLRVWWEVELPILARAAVVSAIFAFTISLGEFGATSFLARPENPTLPVAIYRFFSQPGQMNYGQALAMATILMVVCAVSILLLERLQPDGERKI